MSISLIEKCQSKSGKTRSTLDIYKESKGKYKIGKEITLVRPQKIKNKKVAQMSSPLPNKIYTKERVSK